MISLQTITGPLELGRRIDDTNRAQVFEIVGDDSEVAKVFPERMPGLDQVEQTTRTLLAINMNDDNICLPRRIITRDDGSFAGYTMPRVPDEYSSLKRYIRGIDILFPDWNRRILVDLALGLVEKIDTLHRHGVQLVDIDKLDAMVAEDGSFYLINCDRLEPCQRPRPRDNAQVTAWLYQILMIGRGPVEDFDLPLVNDPASAHHEAQVYWFCLPFPVREAFYDSFMHSIYPSMTRWQELLQGYRRSLDENKCELYIKPSNAGSTRDTTLNLNRLDIDEDSSRDADLRIMENVFHGNDTGRIGVLELSTRNVKLLVGLDPEMTSFDFDAFKRLSVQTLTGEGLDERNRMNMYYFSQRVLPSICYYVSLARTGRWVDPLTGSVKRMPEAQVDTLYVVATAAYRTAENRREILRLIKQEAGIDVCILSKAAEAMATMTAFVYSTPRPAQLWAASSVLMIDQGGGSTEVSPFIGFSDQRPAVSIDLGTNALQNLLLREPTSMRQALDSVDAMIDRRLGEYFAAHERDQVFGDTASRDIYCIAVGSAITAATGKRGNKRQHGTVLTVSDLRCQAGMAEEYLLQNEAHPSDLRRHLSHSRAGDLEQLKNALVMRLGLPIYQRIMEHFGIDRLTVSGTGLWYGIYFQQRPIPLQLNNQ